MEMELTTEKEDERSQNKPGTAANERARIMTERPLAVTKQSRMENENNTVQY